MARIEEVHRRLMNWARWKRKDRMGGLGYARVQLNGVPTRSAYRESIIPTSEGEAVETDEGLRLLSTDLQRAVAHIYLHGRSVRHAAGLLQCSPATVQQRVSQAHTLLNQWLVERQRASQAERTRVEDLQQGRRPE
jgi:DNA-directed RNA polymerase specialized sigma24 family protein